MTYRQSLRYYLVASLISQLVVNVPGARAEIQTDNSTTHTARGLSPSSSRAESAGADPVTGAATYTHPIPLPPGLGGLTPDLDLRYHSGSRSGGWVGLGWQLGMSSVGRSLEKGVPSYTDSDTFELDGHELVPATSEPALPRTYHTRRESFARVVHEADGSWTVTRKDGTRQRFGSTDNSLIANPDVRLPYPAHGTVDVQNATFQWLLSEVEDPRGNVITYTYDRSDPGIAYPKTVRYGLRRLASGAVSEPDDSVDRLVSFVLETGERTDASTNFSAGLERQLRRRLSYIDVIAGGARISRYGMVYESSPDSGRTLLKEVKHYGADAAEGNPTPPLTTSFSYRTNASSSPASDKRGWTLAGFEWPTAFPLVNGARRDSGVRLGDIDGDARPDLIVNRAIPDGSGGFTRSADSGIYLNTGTTFESTSSPHALPVIAAPEYTGAHVFAWGSGDDTQSTGLTPIDLDGDGRADFAGGMLYLPDTPNPHELMLAYTVVHDQDPLSIHRSGFQKNVTGSGGRAFEPVASVDLAPSQGRWDLARFGSVRSEWVPEFPYWLFTATDATLSGSTRFADLTGDGLPEMITRTMDRARTTNGDAPPLYPGTEIACSAHMDSYVLENKGAFEFDRDLHSAIPWTSDCGSATYGILGWRYQVCDLTDPEDAGCARRLVHIESRRVRYDQTIAGVPILVWERHWELGNENVDLNGDGLADSISAGYNTDDQTESRHASLNVGRAAFLREEASYLVEESMGYQDADEWRLPVNLFAYAASTNFSTDLGVRFADVNGDNRIDLVKSVAGVAPQIWLNDGDVNEASDPTPWNLSSSWSLPSGLEISLASGQDNGVRLVDLDGDGMTDIVRSVGATNQVYLNKGEVPDLLETVTNPLGGRTTFGYSPSTSFPAADGVSHAYLPQVLQVVTSIETFDGSTESTSTVSYKGGLFDPANRELRGFREVTTTRPDGRKAVALFYQDEARAGLVEREELRDATGAVWLTTERRYTADTDGPPFVSLPALEIVTESDPQKTPRTLGSAMLYDGFGNRTARTDFGVVSFDGSQVTDIIASDTRTLVHEYAVPSSPAGAPAYIVDRVKRERLLAGTAASGTVLRERLLYYDDQGSLDAIPTRGLLTKQVFVASPGAGSSGPTTTYAHDEYGNLIRERGPRANAGESVGDTTIAYDGTFHSFPVTITNPAGHVRTLGYAPAAGCGFAYPSGAGLAQTERPAHLPANESIRRCFDAFGRLVSERAPGDLAEHQVSYSIPGRTVVRSDRTSAVGAPATWRVETSFLDGLGRPTGAARSGPQGTTISTAISYDTSGRVASETLPSGEDVTYTYDPRDRVLSRTLPGGRTTESSYAPGSLTVIDPSLNSTTRSIDPFGQVVAVTDASGTTTYGYGPSGELEAVIDATGANQTEISYDGLGRRTSIEDPDTGTTTFTAYDAAGNLLSRTDARGKVTSFTYDSLDRPLTRSYVAESGVPAQDRWTYDTAPYGKGSLATREDAAGKLVVLGYDAMGRVFGEKQIVGGRQLVFATTYDGLGQVALRIFPTTPAHTIVWSHDAAGYLTGIATQGGPAYASGIRWDAFERLAEWTAGNGAVSTRGYDPVTARLAEVKVAAGGATLEWLTFGYDASDRVRTIGDLRPDGPADRSFEYDALDRLTQATGPFATGFAETTLRYGYDGLGNLLCKDAAALPGCSGGTEMVYPAAGSPRPHAPVSVALAGGGSAVTPGYDSAGNLTALGTRSYSYDGLGRMTSAREAGKTLSSHGYDASDRRVREDDRSGSRTVTRHFVRPDFEWDATRGLGKIHLSLGGTNVATQVEPCDPPAAMASVAPATRRDPEPASRDTGLALVATAALFGTLLLLLQLAWLRRRAQPVLRPALAATTLLAFCLGLVSPALSLPTGDVNGDGRLDAADALLMRQISQGARIPGADELERADIAPLDQTPETSEPRVHPGDEALLWRALHGDDVDGDGIAANDELALGASPFRIDSDRDGVADDVELGDQSALDDADTDGDG
ncbi:partial Protein RhsD, partial [Burkholderiales bacterium]